MTKIFGCQRGRSFQKEGRAAMKSRISQKGTALVEFALVLPLLLILTFGMIEFAVMMYNQQVITNAAREGARRGIIQHDPRILNDEIEGVVHQNADAHLISFLATNPVPLVNVTANGNPGICNSFGDSLAVEVSYNFHYLVIGNLIPGLGDGITLRSVATMRCE